MELISEHLCKAADVGLHGNIFGGKILTWLDEAAFALAARSCHSPYLVTAKFEEVVFTHPISQGDLVSIFGEIVKIGNTSIKVYLEAKKWLFDNDQKMQTVTSTTVILVKIDPKTNTPSPIKIDAK